jgi:hypothetical protein
VLFANPNQDYTPENLHMKTVAEEKMSITEEGASRWHSRPLYACLLSFPHMPKNPADNPEAAGSTLARRRSTISQEEVNREAATLVAFHAPAVPEDNKRSRVGLR